MKTEDSTSKDIRSLATDLVSQANWSGLISPEKAIVKIIKIAEQAATDALTAFDKNLFGRLPLPLHREIREALKKNLILDAVSWALRDTKVKIKETYHIQTQAEL